ncbi:MULTISPECIES: dihydrolipoamide acetyltransferase family protein [Azospirillum]|nr:MULTISPECIES: dihydrolipoamide acetyltransferase family protein [Azospirillum]MDW7554467.1 dihydrolipoamide acetyltransferase family protein [Azospirillum brasilense]MDW7556340.1 dihydrolipoamide acetyltransferase family protein [Azospirillum brasilense]MDW7594014.1 dihydrolipoamide acetyltransferase family protein [Azospirillum brasilense]MDW7632116.1 dihydrolipoamide acetyltransferase family protein [Azospirillum brasilense]MDX5950016.1 dihydrolipoamide acetyltransferase family protein [A
MVRELVMPKLGLTMTEGVLAEWRVSPGQPFRSGDVLLVVETDKIASEVEADSDGVLIETTIPAGETVAVGTPIARWSADGAGAAPAAEPVEAPAPIAAPTPVAANARPLPAPVRSNGERILSTPLARRRAEGLGVDLAAVTGSGPRGRIKVADVEAAAQTRPEPRPAPQPAPKVEGPTGERSKPTTLQATVARRLTAAKRDVPHFYLAAEAEVTELAALRDRLNADTESGLPRISMTHLVVAAVGRALAAMPEMDRVWDDEPAGGAILALGRGDIGMAVDTPRGLVAPVLRGAATLPLDRLAAEAASLTRRARDGRLTEEDFQGGAVTVSNAGMHNVTYMTSIISPGQSSILGVGSVRSVFRPDAAGAPVLKRELGLVLSADHRLFDGVTALAFLNRIIAGLERPLRLLRAP